MGVTVGNYGSKVRFHDIIKVHRQSPFPLIILQDFSELFVEFQTSHDHLYFVSSNMERCGGKRKNKDTIFVKCPKVHFACTDMLYNSTTTGPQLLTYKPRLVVREIGCSQHRQVHMTRLRHIVTGVVFKAAPYLFGDPAPKTLIMAGNSLLTHALMGQPDSKTKYQSPWKS